MFCALPSASITFAIAVKGGTITTSTSVMSPRSSSIDSTNRADSACVMFIFQLAATIFFLMRFNCHSERSEESLDLSRRGKSLITCEIPRYTRDDKKRGDDVFAHAIAFYLE